MPKLTRRARVPNDIADKILALIRDGNTITDAALVGGISRETFYDWMRRGKNGERGYKKFREQVMTAKALAVAAHVRIIKAATGEHWQAAAWWLERRYPENWGRRERREVTGPQGGPVAHLDVSKLSDEDLQRLADGTYLPPSSDPAVAGGDDDPELR